MAATEPTPRSTDGARAIFGGLLALLFGHGESKSKGPLRGRGYGSAPLKAKIGQREKSVNVKSEPIEHGKLLRGRHGRRQVKRGLLEVAFLKLRANELPTLF